MRSPREISFRLRQEFGNLAMFLLPPAGPHPQQPRSPRFPEPASVAAALRGTPYALEVERIADDLLHHRFPILGLTVNTGPDIDWRRDYLHNVSTGTPYFRRSPYLDFSRAGDHKVIWELNRHQHLVLLAQAFLLTGRRTYLSEAFRQVESWLAANPLLRGINWASALEVAFRALSWAWFWHLAGDEMPASLRARFLTALERHGRFLEFNLSVYFSPNTHLLGEAVALHALGVLFPGFARSQNWVRKGGQIVEQQMDRQVRDDGTHFEQSAYYHVYALDFFLLYRLLAAPSESYDTRLTAMAGYLDALLGVCGILPLIGDDDGGRLFHPYGPRDRFGLATLATCSVVLQRPEWLRSTGHLPEQAAWWLGAVVLPKADAAPAPHGPDPPLAPNAPLAPNTQHARLSPQAPHPQHAADGPHAASEPASPHAPHALEAAPTPHAGAPDAPNILLAPRSSCLFAVGGTAVMTAGDVQLVVKTGPFGEGSGGHSHSDILSLTARLGPREILIDPGTFTYIADPDERNRFRGSAAHNTLRLDGRDQALPAGPFRWNDKPIASLREWQSQPDRDYVDATCSYAGFTHRRRIIFVKPATVAILDRVDGPEGEHLVEQFWHLDQPADAARLSFNSPAIEIDTWRSRALCSREPAKALCVSRRASLPIYLAAILDLSAAPAAGPLEIRLEGEDVVVSRAERGYPPVRFTR
ncbi:MAG: heparinase II/III family protein [Candidatus Solibacter sp.]